MKTRDRQLAVLDLGSSTVNVLVAETDGNGELRLCGSGSAESKGFRKNVLINLDAAVDATRQAVEAAEQAAGLTVERAVISVAGAHIRSVNSRGGVSLGPRPREVVTEDVRRAIEAARSVSLPPGQELLHVLPQEYLLDNQGGIR
ncbi:MAG: cell division protein FtsA, partial [Lysobacteraceae bacterium]